MEFLLSHWHCILPAAAIFIGFFFMNRNKSKGKYNTENRTGGTQNIQNYEEEQGNV